MQTFRQIAFVLPRLVARGRPLLAASSRKPWQPVMGLATAEKPAEKTAVQLKIPKGTTLPYVVTIPNGLTLRIENVTESRAEEVWNMLHETTQKGEGYSVGEVEPLEEFLENMRTEKGYFQVLNEANGDIVSALVLKPSPLCRSEHTAHVGGPVTVSPAYRGKGIGSSTIFEAYRELGQVILGHPGVQCGRTVMGRSLNAIIKTGSLFHGIIPYCSYLEGRGWVHDLAITGVDPRYFKKSFASVPIPELAPLQRTENPSLKLQATSHPISSFPPFTLNGHSLITQYADHDDIWRVEEMFRDAAERSDGFAVDEFTKEGHFNRKLLYDSNVVVAKTSDNVIVATAIFGPSKLCRARNESQMGGYIVVNSDFRRQGLGSAFYRYLSKLAKEAGCGSVLTDAFATCVPAQNFLYKNDFIITGTLPQCGMLKNKGYTDSYMYWRSL